MDSLTLWFEKKYPVFLKDLETLMQINTTYCDDDYPYGKGVEEGLCFFESLGKRMGFKVTKTLDYVYIDLNNKKERMDVVSHVDVVNTEGIWSYDPFSATIVEGRMYGRGAQDMKPQTLITLYVLQYMKEQLIDYPYNVRVVIGSDEERTMDDMRTYVKNEGLPVFAFTPDGSFPVCIGEKGVFTFALEGTIDTDITYMKTFQYSNIIPDTVETFPNLMTGFPEVGYIKGKAAHSSRPELGDNALIKALGKIKEPWAINIYESFRDYHGYFFKELFQPEDSTTTSVNLSQIELEDKHLRIVVDVRYGKPLTQEYLINTLQSYFSNLTLTPLYYDPFTYVDPDNKYVQALMTCYRDVVDDNSPAFISGGVTYAKVFDGKCVSYGPRFKKDGMESMAHQVDEYFDLKLLPTLFEIYGRAMMKLGEGL